MLLWVGVRESLCNVPDWGEREHRGVQGAPSFGLNVTSDRKFATSRGQLSLLKVLSQPELKSPSLGLTTSVIRSLSITETNGCEGAHSNAKHSPKIRQLFQCFNLKWGVWENITYQGDDLRVLIQPPVHKCFKSPLPRRFRQPISRVPDLSM